MVSPSSSSPKLNRSISTARNNNNNARSFQMSALFTAVVMGCFLFGILVLDFVNNDKGYLEVHYQSSMERPAIQTPPSTKMIEDKEDLKALIRSEILDLLRETKAKLKNETVSTLQYRQELNLPKMYLEPTFDEYHDFAKDGPRERPFSLGRSISELLQDSSSVGDKPVNVSFFENKGSYYAAAWLSSTETFLDNPNLNFERVRDNQIGKDKSDWALETGTWVGVRNRENHRTVDMLDFFVHHLSRYKGPYSASGPSHKVNWRKYLSGLDRMQHSYEERPFNNPNLDRNGRVLVFCPFHGAKDGHSGQDERQLHLNVTVKALARVFPNIVITVCDEANLEFVTKHSGLNEYLYDVLLVKDLNMAPIAQCTHLPFLSNVQVRRLLEQGQRYSSEQFQWIYYTESDEPPHLTNVNALLRQALHNRRTVVVPHRSYPVPLAQELNVSKATPTAKKFLEINRHKVLHNVDDLRDYSCCFDSSSQSLARKNPPKKTEWESPEVQLFQQYAGHAQAAGVCNPLLLKCITCSFRSRITEGPCE